VGGGQGILRGLRRADAGQEWRAPVAQPAWQQHSRSAAVLVVASDQHSAAWMSPPALTCSTSALTAEPSAEMDWLRDRACACSTGGRSKVWRREAREPAAGHGGGQAPFGTVLPLIASPHHPCRCPPMSSQQPHTHPPASPPAAPWRRCCWPGAGRCPAGGSPRGTAPPPSCSHRVDGHRHRSSRSNRRFASVIGVRMNPRRGESNIRTRPPPRSRMCFDGKRSTRRTCPWNGWSSAPSSGTTPRPATLTPG